MVDEKFPDKKIRYTFPITIFQYLQNQIKLADTKAAWTFSVLAVGTGALLSRIASIDWSIPQDMKTIMLPIIAAIILVLAFKRVVLVMYPRFSEGKPSGLIYFKDIVSQSKTAYIKKGLALTEEQIIEDLYKQNYDLSKIVDKKFNSLRSAIISTAIALIVTIIVLLTI